MTSEMTRRNQTHRKLTTKAQGQGQGQGQEEKSDKQDKECNVCGKKGPFARDCWSRANQNRTVNEVEGATVDSDAAQELVFTIENLEPKWLRRSRRWFGDDRQRSISQCLSQVVWGICSRETRRTKRQIWLRVGNRLRRYDFHVVEVTKPILGVSYLCENGIETHLARQPLLKYGERHEPFIKKGGVFVKAQIVHEVKGAVETVMQDERSQKSCVRAENSPKFTKVMRARKRFTKFMCTS